MESIGSDEAPNMVGVASWVPHYVFRFEEASGATYYTTLERLDCSWTEGLSLNDILINPLDHDTVDKLDHVRFRMNQALNRPELLIGTQQGYYLRSLEVAERLLNYLNNRPDLFVWAA